MTFKQVLKTLGVVAYLCGICTLRVEAQAQAQAPVQAQSREQTKTTTIVVQNGETVGSLAQRYLTAPATQHWKSIIELNRLRVPYVLKAGQNIKLPTVHIASFKSQASLQSMVGLVEIARGSAAPRQAVMHEGLLEGDRVITKAQASTTLQLADGTVVSLLPESELMLLEHRYYLGRTTPTASTTSAAPIGSANTETSAKGFAGLLRLLQGSLESRAAASNARAKPLRIETPTSVVGVRGTAFRVTHDAIDSVASTRVEVTQGLVQSALDGKRQAAVEAGFGVKMDPASQVPPQAVLLLAPPNVGEWPTSYERETIELPKLASRQGDVAIRGYRVQVSTASQPKGDIVFDRRFAVSEPILITGLPDGNWQIKTRAIDPQGIEGLDAIANMQLKARPLAPVIVSPSQNVKVQEKQAIELSWASVAQATGYQLELRKPSGERSVELLKAANGVLTGLAPGQYQWRLATVKGMDLGPWGDAQQFEVVSQPAPAQVQLEEQQGRTKTLLLRWPDQKAASYEVSIARDANFREDSTLHLKTYKPDTLLINPESGQYFMRYRGIASDGFVSNWSDVMQINVPINWQHLLIYLGGASQKWP